MNMTATISPSVEETLSAIAEKTVYFIDPLRDPRWIDLVERHPQASVFHSTPWLECLRRTYGYEPFAITTTPKGQPLQNGLVLCKVNSWLTGARWVSLPFSDHCQPLADDPADLLALLHFLRLASEREKLKYVELRPLTALDPETESASLLATHDAFCFHALDLRPSADSLFQSFHKSCVQRKLTRAKREELTIEEGQSEKLLGDFYRLMIMTRRRHRLPPQPVGWFRNLLECLGNNAVIHVAFKGSTPVASIFTLKHKQAIVYKYGCSDAAFNNLGGTLNLFWHTMQSAKEQGVELFDFGRTEVENRGLVEFKQHWGSVRTELRYYRFPSFPAARAGNQKGWQATLAGHVFDRLPDACLTAAGNLLYRHVG